MLPSTSFLYNSHHLARRLFIDLLAQNSCFQISILFNYVHRSITRAKERIKRRFFYNIVFWHVIVVYAAEQQQQLVESFFFGVIHYRQERERSTCNMKVKSSNIIMEFHVISSQNFHLLFAIPSNRMDDDGRKKFNKTTKEPEPK